MIKKIVLTGGPGGGKSTGLARIESELQDKGYKVLVVAETATENILGGIKPTEMELMSFQESILRIQTEKEKVYEKIAKLYEKEQPVVILYDRGRMDGKAFMKDKDFITLLKANNVTESDIMDYYDAVFHLKTAADGAEEFYTLDNNEARSESAEEARKVDKRIIEVWAGHNRLRVIDNSTNFEEKINRLMIEIYTILGTPKPLEVERRYVVGEPNIEEISKYCKVKKIEIIQAYLKEDNPKEERRVRQRGINGEYSYFYTKKQDVTPMTRIETERRITEREYLTLLMDAKSFVRKDRYCFVYNDTYYELDISPMWKHKGILETELSNEAENVNLPPFLHVLYGVTENMFYRNRSIAENGFPI